MTDTTPTLIQPPKTLNTTVTDPQTGQPTYAFPLQTAAWLKLQTAMKNALTFPTSTSDFTTLYGTFTDEGSVTQAVGVLAQLKTTADQYGDPATLISQLTSFAQANTHPTSIYGHGVWLAAQTIVAAQQIQTLLKEGLTDIGDEPSPTQRLQDLTELLTGQGGVSSYATTLQSQIKDFQAAVSTFYGALNAEISGPTNSLQSYLAQSANVLAEAKSDYNADVSLIDTLDSNLHKLNEEYIGFTVAASVAPVFLIIPPPVGILLAVADAATFATMAILVKKQIDSLKSEISDKESDEAKKLLLKTNLTTFNTQTQDISVDGTSFVAAIGTLAAGWGEFQSQITARLTDLTADDVKDWSQFMQKLNFQTALTEWGAVATNAETFYQAGFVRFAGAPT